MKKYEKLKLVIVFVLSVVLFSAGFTSFASTGKTHVNVKSKNNFNKTYHTMIIFPI